MVTHLVSLRQAAGVEAHFSEFVRTAHAIDASYRHGWLDPAGGLHPIVEQRLAGQLEHVVDAKHLFGVRLPAHPAALRTWHCRRALAARGTRVLVVWNRTAKTRFAVDAVGAARSIHWEHGAAWDPGREVERREYLARVPLAIANSVAAERVLRLLWNYRGEVRVCRNALRPSLVPAAATAKRFPREALRLGVAARLYPVKGVVIVVHALAALRRRGLPAELRIAGEGPERERLAALAARLGVADAVTFLGAVSDMAAFYASVDCLLHVPVTEAFGLVAAEAPAHGCPVVAACVDGLAEAVEDGVTGTTLPPTLPLARYVELGGAIAGLPDVVYDPAADALVTPRVIDPETLADRVAHVFADARRYEALSAGASAAVLARPSFAAHVRDVLAVIDEVARRGER